MLLAPVSYLIHLQRFGTQRLLKTQGYPAWDQGSGASRNEIPTGCAEMEDSESWRPLHDDDIVSPDRQTDVENKEISSSNERTCKVYKRRWYVLFVFTVTSMVSNMMWNTSLAKWLLEFLGIPRIFLGIPRNLFLGIPRNSQE